MIKLTPCASPPLNAAGIEVKALFFKQAPGDKFINVYASYNDGQSWVPLHIGLPSVPSLQQVRDMDRNIYVNSGSFEDAHMYLRSADGNNMTVAFYANADGGAIQAGNANGLSSLNLQPEGGLLNYGGYEVATKNWTLGQGYINAEAAETVLSASVQPRNVTVLDTPGVNEKTVSPSVAGTYVNFSSVEIVSDDFTLGDVQLRLVNGTWVKRIIPISLISYMRKMDYIQDSKNLIDINATDVALSAQLDNNGNTTTSATLNTTGKFAVKPNTDYTFSPRVRFIAWYNSAGTFISPIVSITGTTLPSTATSPATAAFSRQSILQTVWANAQAEEGSYFTSYEPFGSYIKPEFLKLTSSQVTNIADVYYRKLVNKIGKMDTDYLTQSKNLFNKNATLLTTPKLIPDTQRDGTNGADTVNTTYSVYGPIPLISGQSITSSIPGVSAGISRLRNVAVYNSAGTFISGGTNTNTNIFTLAAANGAFVYVTLYNAGINTGSLQIEYGTSTSAYAQYGYFLDADVISQSSQQETITPMYWAAMGDSITIQNLWTQSVSSKLTLVFTNLGIAGTKMSGTGSTNTDSMWQDLRVDAIPLNTQVYTIMAGMNDYAQSKKMGTIDSVDPDTFMGAYNLHLQKVITRIPLAHIFIIGTTFGFYPPGGRPGWSDPIRNMEGFNTNDYAEAARQIAVKWHVYYINAHQLGWNDLNASLFTTDNIHPNQAGADRISKSVIKALNGTIR